METGSLIIWFYLGLLVFALNGLVMLGAIRKHKEMHRDVIIAKTILTALRLRRSGRR